MTCSCGADWDCSFDFGGTGGGDLDGIGRQLDGSPTGGGGLEIGCLDLGNGVGGEREIFDYVLVGVTGHQELDGPVCVHGVDELVV